jgi:hypothetical protein
MANINDIQAAKNDALKCAQDEVDGAMDAKNAATGAQAVAMTGVVNEFSDKRTAILLQQYLGGLDSQKMQDALNAITSATTDMKTVAQNMKDATTYIANAAAFLNAGSKVVSALKA